MKRKAIIKRLLRIKYFLEKEIFLNGSCVFRLSDLIAIEKQLNLQRLKIKRGE